MAVAATYCPQAMYQVIQIASAVLILAAFAAAQLDLLGPHSRLYLVLNLVGAATLTVLAWDGQQWGFLLQEAAWTLVSGWGLLRVLRGQARARVSGPAE